MTCEHIFRRVDAHIIRGLMYHEQMADYFDFLNLHGYKRLHECRYLEESAAMRGLHRYYINHYDELLPSSGIENPNAIPANWYGHMRADVTAAEKKEDIKRAFDSWVKWEKETKKLYQSAYCDLCDLGEVAAACKIKQLLECADQELKRANRMRLSLDMVNYDLSTIYLCQDEIHEAYRMREKDIGVDIC